MLTRHGVPRGGDAKALSSGWLDNAPQGDLFVGSHGRVFDACMKFSKRLQSASKARSNAGIGTASTSPIAKTVRTVGYLSPRSSDVEAELLRALQRGLRETGHAEGKDIAIEYRWAEGRYDRLPILASELVDRQAAVIATTGGPQAARAVLAATSTIPLVFLSGSDPVADGLVKRFDRPDGNATGVHVFTTSLGPKRLQLLRELVPKARTIAFLVNRSSQVAEMQMTQMRDTASSIGQAIMILNASTESEIELAFASLVRRGAGALLMSADTFFQVQRDQLVALAARHAVPAMYEWPEFVRGGGLMSYSAARAESFLQAGIYAGRILNGAKIADLPVVQSTKFELVINLKTAKTLGLDVPLHLQQLADEVIE
jgi:putative ABC transport system substrate-binding protein